MWDCHIYIGYVGSLSLSVNVILTNCLYGMGVFCRHSKGSLEVMVNFVNALVERAMMQQPMGKILPRVFDYHTQKHLEKKHIPGQRNV